ncbi:MAG: hypothetical protein HY671_03105 [Chloroflexi bacterium]|nr:hypothetical protein [Chloroflexota bacterium]
MKVKRLLIVPVVAAIVVVGGMATFGFGRYVPPNLPPPAPEKIPPPAYVLSTFTDIPQTRRGTLLVDEAHFNIYGEQEIAILLSRVAARGFGIQFVGDLNIPMGSDAAIKDRESQLEDKLRTADSFLVVLPWHEFTPRERELVRAFVQRGGRLVLVGDPTRRNTVNGVAQDFGIIFSDDYLYNVKEHEANFRYIYLRDFAPHEITKGLKSVVFYVASSITPESGGLMLTDTNTFSSTREHTGRFSPLVQAAGGKVIALSDVTFMGAPYNAIADNDRLMSNIADFLTISERKFNLSEFPNFFGAQVDVIAGGDEVLPSAQSLLGLIASRERTAELKERETYLSETVFVGLWENVRQVDQYLSSAGIRIDQTITTPSGSGTRREGTALVFLHENQGRHILIILGDTADVVKEVVARLRNGEFRRGLVSDNLGIYPIVEPAPQRPAVRVTPGSNERGLK